MDINARLDMALDAFCRADLDVVRIARELRANRCEVQTADTPEGPGVLPCWRGGNGQRSDGDPNLCAACHGNAVRVQERTAAKVKRSGAKRALIAAWMEATR